MPFEPPFLPNIRNDDNIDWNHDHSARYSFANRLAHAYLANEWCSDISFYVPMADLLVPAHSLIVAAASRVLQRICFGSGLLVGGNIINVPDYCTTNVLHVVLRYLYTGDPGPGIDETNVCLVWNMADYYELFDLQSQCEEVMESILSASNVCRFFNDLHDSLRGEMFSIADRYMRKNIRENLANGSVMEMDDAALGKLLGANTLMEILSEMEVVTAMVDWVDVECERRSLANTPANRRQLLRNRKYMINYGAMSLFEFQDCVRRFGDEFFTVDEVLLTYKQICRRNDPRHSNDQTVYPFAAYKRCDALARINCAVDAQPHDLTEFEINGWKRGDHLFTIDVSHMKQPFTLTDIKTHHGDIVQIENRYSRPRIVPFTMRYGYAHLVDGVRPDERGRISLTICKTPTVLYYTTKPLAKNHPRLMSTRTGISSFVYTNPK